MTDLHFSRATLVLAGNGTRPERGATRPYVIHQLVGDLFGDYEKRPFLYRIEGSEGTSQPVLILSHRPPEPVAKVPGRNFGTVRTVQTKPFDLDLPPNTCLDFEIRINATRDLKTNGGTRRTDVWEAVWKRDKGTEQSPDVVYGEYLARKLEAAAEVVSCHVVERGFVRARKNLKRAPITFVSTNLIGMLRVDDAQELRQIVAQGIGRSKSFGCGLLCLSRPASVLPRRYPEHATRMTR